MYLDIVHIGDYNFKILFFKIIFSHLSRSYKINNQTANLSEINRYLYLLTLIIYLLSRNRKKLSWEVEKIPNWIEFRQTVMIQLLASVARSKYT